MTYAADKECGFSCSFAKKDTRDILEDLVRFSEYDPVTAIEIIDEISNYVENAKRIVYANAR